MPSSLAGLARPHSRPHHIRTAFARPAAIKFLTYEQLSRKISHYLIDQGGDGKLTPALRLVAGAGAGIIGMSATYPMDMVRPARCRLVVLLPHTGCVPPAAVGVLCCLQQRWQARQCAAL